MYRCRICGESYRPFIDFGKQPIANGFLKPHEFDTEFFFDMEVGQCPECKMVQLSDFPQPDQMFNRHYQFFSSTSTVMEEHFDKFAGTVINYYLPQKDPFVVEIGSNDGILLKNFVEEDIRCIGVDPSANVAQVARGKGVRTIIGFFDEEMGQAIAYSKGQADVILAANAMCHIPNLHPVLSGMADLLKFGGYIIFEDPYLGDVIEKTSFDQFYDEHSQIFSVTSIDYLFGLHNLRLIDIEPQPTHGGSMRYIITNDYSKPRSTKVTQALEEEKLKCNARMLGELAERIEKIRTDFKGTLTLLKEREAKVCGYAAASKSTTVLNYCDIGPDLIECIFDTTPDKIGKFSPGMHIPIRDHKEFADYGADFAVLHAWNHLEEIMGKEREWRDTGGKFIIHVPEVHAI